MFLCAGPGGQGGSECGCAVAVGQGVAAGWEEVWGGLCRQELLALAVSPPGAQQGRQGSGTFLCFGKVTGELLAEFWKGLQQQVLQTPLFPGPGKFLDVKKTFSAFMGLESRQ